MYSKHEKTLTDCTKHSLCLRTFLLSELMLKYTLKKENTATIRTTNKVGVTIH